MRAPPAVRLGLAVLVALAIAPCALSAPGADGKQPMPAGGNSSDAQEAGAGAGDAESVWLCAGAPVPPGTRARFDASRFSDDADMQHQLGLEQFARALRGPHVWVLGVSADGTVRIQGADRWGSPIFGVEGSDEVVPGPIAELPYAWRHALVGVRIQGGGAPAASAGQPSTGASGSRSMGDTPAAQTPLARNVGGRPKKPRESTIAQLRSVPVRAEYGGRSAFALTDYTRRDPGIAWLLRVLRLQGADALDVELEQMASADFARLLAASKCEGGRVPEDEDELQELEYLGLAIGWATERVKTRRRRAKSEGAGAREGARARTQGAGQQPRAEASAHLAQPVTTPDEATRCVKPS